MSQSGKSLVKGCDRGRVTTAGPGGLGPEMRPPSTRKQADPLRDRSRRKAFAWTGAVAVASSLAVFGFSASAYGTVYETGRGEIRLVPLHDGSTMFLNTSSKVRVNYGQREERKSVV